MREIVTAQSALREHSVLFRSCIRCNGDRQIRRDVEGFYIACLACGHVSYPKSKPRKYPDCWSGRPPPSSAPPHLTSLRHLTRRLSLSRTDA